MTDLFPDVRPGTDEDRRRISDEVYRRNEQLHASAARRAMADAVIQRDLEHADQLELFRLQVELIWLRWPGEHTPSGPRPYEPHLYGGRLALDLLEQFGAAWAATEARHDAAIAAALHRLESLEEQK